jgi:predicted nucleotidyltransferase
MYQIRNKELEVISLYRGNYKSEFYLRQISKISNVPLKTCQDTLKNLERNNILKSRVDGKNKYFGLNLDNIQTKFYLLQAEIYKTNVFLEKYPQIKTFLKSINKNIPIIVFGSFAKLKTEKDSDLDLLIISEKETKPLSYLLPFKVHQIDLTETSFMKALNQEEALIKEIEENHIVLNNHSFYVNVMWEKYAK